MTKAVIVSAVRSGIGKYGGQWSNIEPYQLAAKVIREAVDRAKIDENDIEDVIMGNLYGRHGNIARVASLEAGLPITAGAMTLDRQCSSSVQTIWEAAANIMAGNGEVYVACGLEHMTKEPYQLEKVGVPNRITGPSTLATMLTPDTSGKDRMGMTAEQVAEKYSVTREEMDRFAVWSTEKAIKAIDRGAFKEQILPIEVKINKKETKVIDSDEPVRRNTSFEIMQKLRPAFIEGGKVTAANSCPNADGASALVIMSEEKAKREGIEIMATVKSYAVNGVDPHYMGIGPVYAVPKALKRAGITVDDLDVIELNEAFAAQSIPCIRELNFPEEKVNPNGGALALGHPLGATGGILTTKILYHMIENNLRYGLVTMCIGGGQGAALVLERE